MDGHFRVVGSYSTYSTKTTIDWSTKWKKFGLTETVERMFPIQRLAIPCLYRWNNVNWRQRMPESVREVLSRYCHDPTRQFVPYRSTVLTIFSSNRWTHRRVVGLSTSCSAVFHDPSEWIRWYPLVPIVFHLSDRTRRRPSLTNRIVPKGVDGLTTCCVCPDVSPPADGGDDDDDPLRLTCWACPRSLDG